jgi:hypothetical protein
VEVDVDFGNYGILDVDVSMGGGIHPHIQHPKKSGCQPLITYDKEKITFTQREITLTSKYFYISCIGLTKK